jgi:curli production assembly/transport component CsgF
MNILHRILLAVPAGMLAGQVWAAPLIYTPINPSFGGNPNNGPVLMNSAQAQNKTKDPEVEAARAQAAATAAGTSTGSTLLQQFNQSLQRTILSRLSVSATSSLIGNNGNLIPGVVDTGDFLIQILDQGGGLLRVTTTDKASGESVSFQVGNR